MTTAKPRTKLCLYTHKKDSAWEKIKTSHSPPPKTNFKGPMQNSVTIVRTVQLKTKTFPIWRKSFSITKAIANSDKGKFSDKQPKPIQFWVVHAYPYNQGCILSGGTGGLGSSHSPFWEAIHKKNHKRIVNIMTEIKINSLDKYLITISTLWHCWHF